MHTRHLILAIVALLLLVISANAQDAAAEVGLKAGEKLLAWVGPGDVPGQQRPNTPGDVVYILPDGTLEPVLALAPQTSRVQPCGASAATSPDGQHFAFFVGIAGGGIRDRGTLYLVNGTEANAQPIETELYGVTCIGAGLFAFSADSTQMAYMDYPDRYNVAASPSARLFIKDTATLQVIAEYANVAAFDMTDGGAAFVSFFYNNDQEAVEVAFSTWDGTRDREIAAIRADEGDDCRYISASITELADGHLASVLGYQCRRGETRSQWQLYIVDPETRSATQVRSAAAPGAYFPFSGTNQIFASPDGAQVYFTVPDGFTNRTASLYTIQTSGEAALRQILLQALVMPTLSIAPYDAGNHTPVQSPDGRWLALVENTPDNDASLLVLDLAAPQLPPIRIPARSRGDSIGEMLFAADSSRLYFVSGANRAGDNSLFELELETGSDFRVDRGRFEQGVSSPDGTQLALMNWQIVDDDEPPFLNLLALNATTGLRQVLFEGAAIVNEDVTDQRFVYPLSWRRGE